VHHGLANAIALPHVIRFNAPDAAAVYAEVARALGLSSSTSDEEATEALAKGVADLSRRVGLPLRYRDVGVPESDLPAIAELAVTDGSIVYNPRLAMDPDLVLGVLKAAW
jgi:alcohol dehydrogenase class IV